MMSTVSSEFTSLSSATLQLIPTAVKSAGSKYFVLRKLRICNGEHVAGKQIELTKFASKIFAISALCNECNKKKHILVRMQSFDKKSNEITVHANRMFCYCCRYQLLSIAEVE
jgi:hypothetical protein